MSGTQEAPIRQHRTDVNGIRIYFLEAGTGEPVVLLHGFPETSHAWRKIIPTLAKTHRIIAPDIRGFGASDRPTTGYDKKTVASDIFELLKKLGIDSVNLVGHDVGMMVAYAFAITYPSTVKRLALMEAALPGFGLEELYDAIRYPRMYHLPLFEAPNGLAEALITGRELMFVRHFMLQQAYVTENLEESSLEEYAKCLAAPGSLQAGIAYFRAHKEDAAYNKEHGTQSLSMPVLTVGGTASFGANLEPEIRPLATNMRSVMIEDCGHYLAEERPERLTKELLTFFAEPV